MGNCQTTRAIAKEVIVVDANDDGKISRSEMMQFIDHHLELWSLLADSCCIPEKKSRKVARDTAYVLAKKPANISVRDMTKAERRREPTTEEFEAFLKKVLADPNEKQEFLYRSIFNLFDINGDGYLEPCEMDGLVDLFYDPRTSFCKNSSQLPDKITFKSNILKEYDLNGDGQLDFSEVRPFLAQHYSLPKHLDR